MIVLGLKNQSMALRSAARNAGRFGSARCRDAAGADGKPPTASSSERAGSDEVVKRRRVLLFWIVTPLEVAEHLSRPANTRLINFRV
jgi:hypothetical protein